ncbi:CPCC family cysteine-rich protein [Nonomuraea sp. NPDC051941]|uniref:CPCC family cysteine-rich protein n=1 Tax=Nonomuraea sp. NPDC051941 TaxID=3364373 RepID=UPI0037C5A3DB
MKPTALPPGPPGVGQPPPRASLTQPELSGTDTLLSGRCPRHHPIKFSNYEVSLTQGRRNFAEFGASRRQALPHVRAPRPDEYPDR